MSDNDRLCDALAQSINNVLALVGRQPMTQTDEQDALRHLYVSDDVFGLTVSVNHWDDGLVFVSASCGSRSFHIRCKFEQWGRRSLRQAISHFITSS